MNNTRHSCFTALIIGTLSIIFYIIINNMRMYYNYNV